MSQMPLIDVSGLSGREREIAEACLNHGRLRASKPKGDGEAKYVWRMVAFSISPNYKHHCLPMGAEFDMLDEYWSRGSGTVMESTARWRARMKELDVLVDKMVDSVPKAEWHGVKRWANVL